MKSFCRSLPEFVGSELAFLAVEGIDAQLRGGRIEADARRQIIEGVRAGKHVELSVQAITFRQRDGSPNKNFLRFKTEKLADIAASFVGKPMLLDHNKWEQTARMGTITASELVELPHGWAGFRQTFRVVKPHAVTSILDGTLDMFSIGWDPSYPVFCTAHKSNLRGKGACGCWPGDRIKLDDKLEVVEYEWQATEGLETSGVNTPAVTGTKIEDTRTALAAELGIARHADPEIPVERDRRPYDARLAVDDVPILGENLASAAEQLGLDPDEFADYVAAFDRDGSDNIASAADQLGFDPDELAEYAGAIGVTYYAGDAGDDAIADDPDRDEYEHSLAIASAAEQLGMDPDELAEYAGGML